MIGFIEHVQNVTTNNYDSPTELHTSKITVTTKVFSVCYVFTGRCLVADSHNVLRFRTVLTGWRQSHNLLIAPTVHSQPTVLLITPRNGPHRKHLSSVAVSNCCRAIHACLRSRYSVIVTVYLLILLSLPTNGSPCHNIIIELFLKFINL
jgi:hypothetical protein